MQIVIKGYPVSFHMQDLRAKADRMALRGDRDEAALLHALLDDYAPGAQQSVGADLRELRKDLDTANEEKGEAEVRADKAEETADFIKEAALEALEAVQKGLAYQYEGDSLRAISEFGRAVGALSSALK